VFASSCSLLIRGNIAAVRQEIHLSLCPNFPNHLSYEQASYAIQDTPEMVAQHYGRFLPQDKAALAAKILNQVWEAA
jgi:hypothetical protein